MQKFNVLLILLLPSLLVSCSSVSVSPSEVYKNHSESQIYRAGEVALAKRSYKDAIQAFEALDSLYPFGAHTQQAQLNILYAYYEAEELPSAEAAAERYIRLYPRSPHVDYAYYMKGLANFEQDQNWLLKWLPFDIDTSKDHSTLEQAFIDFGDFIRLFPDSPYAPDARQRMVYLRNTFAAHELQVAEFYIQKKAYVAAANRAAWIIRQYRSTPQARHALQILVQAHQALGLNQTVAQVKQVQALNKL